MATYLELNDLVSNDALRIRVRVACVVAAEAIRRETTPTALRLAWAKRVMESPVAEAERMMWAVLAQNRAAAVAAIEGATDAAIQTAVEAAVDLFAV